jgi:4-amino-4-deoxy-L-arabinose transferase-like glycosyltransferase
MGQIVETSQDPYRARDYKSASPAHAHGAGFIFVMRTYGWLVAAVLLAAMLKAILLAANAVPFNSDEAVVALMARHILQGERPIFFYGQSYMGSLDAWLAAAAFKILGEGVLPVRLVQVELYLGYLLSLWLLARSLFTDRLPAVLAVFLGAVPVVLVTTYTTASLGGYGETLVFGNLILWLGYQLAYGEWEGSYWAWLVFGLVAGLAFWTLAMSLVYLLPVGILIVRRYWAGADRRLFLGVILFLAGWVVGSMPWWYANLSGGWQALRVLLGSAVIKTTFIERLTALLLLGLPALAGMRFPWSSELSPLPVAFVYIVLYLAAGFVLLRGAWRGSLPLAPGAGWLLGSFAGCFILIFLLTRYGIDATGRYLLPLSTLLVLAMALFISIIWRHRRVWGMILLLCTLALNGMETVRAAGSPEGITTQFDPVTRFDNRYDNILIDFLRQKGELNGYSNYWVSFKLAFLSGEELIYAARLPYKPDLSYSPGDNRIPSYSQQADGSLRVAYITSLHTRLDEILGSELRSLRVTFNERQIGPYHVFFNLSRPVRPEELQYGAE